MISCPASHIALEVIRRRVPLADKIPPDESARIGALSRPIEEFCHLENDELLRSL